MRGKIAVLLFFILLAAFITWPLILHLNTYILDKQDGLLITWFLNWSIAHPLNYNANIFFPYQNTLAYSETMLPQALIAAPFVKLFGEPLLAYNINLILGIALTGFACYLLFNKNFPLSLLFVLNPIYLGYAAHIQIINFWPVVFAIYCLQKQRWKLFIFFFVIASLTTVLFFYFMLLIIAVKFIKEDSGRATLARMTTWGIFLTIPFLIPHYLVSRQFNYVRPITDAIHNSIAPSDFLTQFFPGVGLIILLVFCYKNFKTYFVSCILFLVSLVLAFGPALHIVKNTIHMGIIPFIPLPYTLLYYIVPGFQGLRTPSRWILLALLFAFIIISQKVSKKITLLALIFLLLFDLRLPFNYQTVFARKDFPVIMTTSPVIYFPIYGWWDYPGVLKETERMYYSIGIWRPMFNGYSGFSSREWEEKVKWLQKIHPQPGEEPYEKYF